MRVDESWWELKSDSLICVRLFLTLMHISRSNENKVALELRSESLYESFLNSHALVKREQLLHETWWELRSERLITSFLKSHVQVKRGWKLMRVESLPGSYLNSHNAVIRELEFSDESWWSLNWQLACHGQRKIKVKIYSRLYIYFIKTLTRI